MKKQMPGYITTHQEIVTVPKLKTQSAKNVLKP